MKGLFILFLLVGGGHLYAQKKVIDSSEYNPFPYLGRPIISNNGGFVTYNFIKEYQSNGMGNSQAIVQSLSKFWKIEVSSSISTPRFSSNNKFCFFIRLQDSLGIINLKNKKIRYISNVDSYDLNEDGDCGWLIYLLKNAERTIVIRNLETNDEKLIHHVSEYYLSKDGKVLILKRAEGKNFKNQSIEWMNLIKGTSTVICSGRKIEDITIDFKHEQLAFKSNDSVFFYKQKELKTGCLATYSFLGIEGLELHSINRFSKEGDRLFLKLIQKDHVKPIAKTEIVEILSYTDIINPIQHNSKWNQKLLYNAVVDLTDKRVIQLQKNGDEYWLNNSSFDKHALVSYQNGYTDFNQKSWMDAAKPCYDLVNTYTGKRTPLRWLDDVTTIYAKLSPDERFVLYYNTKERAYFSYDVISGENHNLTGTTNTSWGKIDDDHINPVLRGVAGWFLNDEAVCIYDTYDIWKLDPSGKIAPINLTNGYGMKHRIVFNFGLSDRSEVIIPKNEMLILSAFNLENKDNGFFRKSLNKISDPEPLKMGSYIYFCPQATRVYPYGWAPIKAKNADAYILQRMNTTDAPNYFSTRDFRTFTRLTNLQPQKEYNWYTTELHNWKSLDGRALQGVLYKPENFDPNKKYPVIFYYYERLSDRLNLYLRPEPAEGSIDIPTYVSNGYLVFCPDIYYPIGNPMQGTHDAIVSAAEYISKLPFVNSKKMGLHGHSFGGGQTNYLIATTNLFAAACSSSGIADWISAYGTTYDGVNSKAMDFEMGQYRVAATPWTDLDVYIKNSPIFQANQVTTPLLMMHTKKDDACPYPNALEFFTGLRRLGKKAWMLVYSNGNHTISGAESVDFNKRMMQFFDHYLKDKSTPLWMLENGSSSKESLEAGFALDLTGRTPGPGILTPEEQLRVDSLMTRKPVTITLK